MKKTFLLLSFVVTLQAHAQPSQAARDSLNRITRADYEQMLGQLGLKPGDMRPGPSGDPSAPNAANRFEDKIAPYALPDPLQLKNGKKIKTSTEWNNQRRKEIVEDFEREIYGRLPNAIPKVTWQVVSVKDTVVGNLPIKEKVLKGIVDNSAYPSLSVNIELLVATPRNAQGSVPLVIEFGWIVNPFNRAPVQPIGVIS